MRSVFTARNLRRRSGARRIADVFAAAWEHFRALFKRRRRMQRFSPENTPRRSPKKPRQRRPWGRIVFKTLLALFALGVVGVIGIFAYFAKDLPGPDKINARFVAESTKIYDRTGDHLLYDIHGEEKRTIIPFSDMPDVVKFATIALEDDRFYDHIGFDIGGNIKAVLSEIGVGSPRGGSTITQQFIKNSVLGPERTYARKIKELILSLELEQKFSKDEILAMYLNEIPYGSNAYGIEAAAQTFFDKNARDLSLDEAAMLAALPQAPTRYSPYGSRRDQLKVRQESALQKMADGAYITQAQADAAKAIDIFSTLAKNRENINAPHFVIYVRELLQETYGEDVLEKSGLRVFTTLDWELQQAAEQAVRDGVEKNKERWDAENAALVAADPKTGAVLAMVGSRDFFDTEIDGQVNVALANRQPGSSFKPYVYLAGFARGYSPETILHDVKTSFATTNRQSYEPQNYDGHFRGAVKIKEALGQSLNIPAVKMLYLVGVPEAIAFARRLGITSLRSDTPERYYGLSLVLGGGEVRLLDHVGAFATLANDGVRHTPFTILRVENADGTLREEHRKEEGEFVVEKKYITALNHILSTNKYRAPAFGEQNPLRFDDHTVVAKTGTTNEYRDGWTMGYTPQIAVGVWAGNNDNRPMRAGAAGANVAAPIWRAFLESALPRFDTTSFEKYKKDEFKTGKDILDGEFEIDTDKVKVCEIDDDEYCRENKHCPRNKEKKRIFIDTHNILYYVDKKDPRGDTPKDPKNDTQFKAWEKGLEKYYKKLGKVVFDEKPRECRKGDFESEQEKKQEDATTSVQKDASPQP